MFYTIPPEWREYINERGLRRHLSHKKGTSQKFDNTRNDLQVNIDGVAGEWASWLYLGGTWPDDNADGSPDPGWDIVTPDGLRWQAKATRWPNGFYGLKPGDRLIADRGVLAIVNDRGVHVSHWITRERFEEKCRQQPTQHNVMTVVDQRYMQRYPAGAGIVSMQAPCRISPV